MISLERYLYRQITGTICRTSIIITLLIAGLSISLTLGCGKRQKKKVVAYVNEEQIPARDFLEFYNTRPRIADWSSREGKLDPNQVLDAIIDKVLMVQRAKRLGLDRSQGFKAQIEKFREKELINQFVNKTFDTRSLITDEEIAKAIPEYKKKEVRFARICVLTEDKAWEIKRELDQGKDFAQLARERSIGLDAENGGIGDFLSPHRGIYHKDVIERIFNLPFGHVSNPQKIREGYALFKPIEDRPLNPGEMEQIVQYKKTLMSREKKGQMIRESLEKLKQGRKIALNHNAIKEISSMGRSALKHKDYILAKGKGVRVRWKDIKGDLTPAGGSGKILWEDPNLFTRIVNSRVEQKLLLLEAKKAGFENDPDLAKDTDRFAQDLLVRQLMINEIENNLVVEEEECRKYYQDNLMVYTEPEMVRVSHILVKDKNKAQEMLLKLRDGADFGALAREYSEYKASSKRDGDMGFIRRGDSGMGNAFEEEAFSLDKGQISDLIETPFGYQIVTITDKKEAGILPFDEVKDKIRQTLFNQKRQNRFKMYLKDLKNSARIRIDREVFQDIKRILVDTG